MHNKGRTLCETLTGSATTTSGHAAIEGKSRVARDLRIITALPFGAGFRSAAGSREAARRVERPRTLHHLLDAEIPPPGQQHSIDLTVYLYLLVWWGG